MSKRAFHHQTPKRRARRSAAEQSAYETDLIQVATEIVLGAAVELAAARFGLDAKGAATFREDVATLYRFRAAQLETAARAVDAERVKALRSAASNAGAGDGVSGAARATDD